MRKKDTDTFEGESFAAPAPGPATKIISPLDIQQKEFAVSRLSSGYRMQDVDEFLDRVTESMTEVLKQNEQLRKGAGAPPLLGTPDLDDVNRQADEIIQRARDEAGRIVAEAREQAAVLTEPGAAAAVAGASAADRTAINAFLAREKEFLQSLAGLVQGHAEGVKSMARSARRPAPATEAAPAAPVPSTPVEKERPEAVTPRASETPKPETTVAIPPMEEPVRVSEPEPAAVRVARPTRTTSRTGRCGSSSGARSRALGARDRHPHADEDGFAADLRVLAMASGERRLAQRHRERLRGDVAAVFAQRRRHLP